jgi:hypothetical protein
VEPEIPRNPMLEFFGMEFLAVQDAHQHSGRDQ